MKKIVFTICLGLLISFANGQIIKSIGINGGVSLATQEWQYRVASISIDPGYRPGLYSSIALEFLNCKNFNIVTEFAYAEKGNHQEVTLTTIDQPEGVGKKTLDTKFSYLEFSPLFKGQLEKEGVTLFALLGPRLDFLLSYKSDFDFKEVEDEYTQYIFGLTAGAGVEVKLKQFGIKLESQYHHDFDDVLNTDKSDLVISNKAFIISLGLKYYLKPKTDS